MTEEVPQQEEQWIKTRNLDGSVSVHKAGAGGGYFVCTDEESAERARLRLDALEADLKQQAATFLAMQETSDRIHCEVFDAVVAERDAWKTKYHALMGWRYMGDEASAVALQRVAAAESERAALRGRVERLVEVLREIELNTGPRILNLTDVERRGLLIDINQRAHDALLAELGKERK